MHRFHKLEELPPRIRNKIQLEKLEGRIGEAPTELLDHWIWTGAFVKSRTRVKPRPPLKDDRRHQHTSHFEVRERGTPTVFVSGIGSMSAFRYVQGLARGLQADQLDRLPRLRRCSNDRCVSPYCASLVDKRGRNRVPQYVTVQPGPVVERTPEQKRRIVQPPRTDSEDTHPALDPDAILKRLQNPQYEPNPEWGIENAAQTIDRPIESITPEVWQKYCRWSDARD